MNVFAQFCNLRQIIEDETRVTFNTQSLLDLIFVSASHSIIGSGEISTPSCLDHDLIFCNIEFLRPSIAQKYITIRKLNYIDPMSLQLETSKYNWNSIYECETIDDKVDQFDNIVLSIFDRLAPKQKILLKKRKLP